MVTDSAATRPPDAALRAARVIAVSSAPALCAVVRDQIKEFASTRIMYSSAPKMIILDEADNMTSAAQSALRRVIEKYTKNARFCLICNYASKIIPALQSRCTRFRFAPLGPEQCLERVRVVADTEQVKYVESGLQACVRF
jgi:replication factor C subunit 3/5